MLKRVWYSFITYRKRMIMPFSSVLSTYCNALGCTNKEIAEYCGISPSALTRYRKGERVPEVGSDTIANIAAGLSALASEKSIVGLPDESLIRSTLEGGMEGMHTLGMSFCARFDALMMVMGIRNADIARELKVSPSYISRIRAGHRAPADRAAFASICARYAAECCRERNCIPDELRALLSSAEMTIDWLECDLSNTSSLVDVIVQWLMGNNITRSDVSAMEELFRKMDGTVFIEQLERIFEEPPCETIGEPPEEMARFFYKKDLHNSMLSFFDVAARHGAREVFLSSDMPMLGMAFDSAFISAYNRGIAKLVRSGCKMHVLHSVERPLAETIMGAGLWIPPLMAGDVTYYGLLGVSSRMFYHSNYVCESCALSAEAVMNYEDDGRSYFTTVPNDIRYYRRKMGHIMSHATPLVEVFREDDPKQRRLFRKADRQRKASGEGREILSGKYKNLRVELYPGDCAVLSMLHDSPVHFVTRDPKMRYAISHIS